MRLFFFLIFAFVSLFFRFFFRFFFRRWPDDADVRKCKTLEEKNEQKKTKKTAAYKCILGLQFFFGFWFCFFLLFVSLLSCSDCFFFGFAFKKMVCITFCFLLIVHFMFSSFYRSCL
jgi:hypothetical protein